MCTTKDRGLRELSVGINPRQIPRERAKDREAPGPRERGSLFGLTLHPVQNDTVGDWAAMTLLVCEQGEGGDVMALHPELKTKGAALGQIVLGEREHRACVDHCALPGQGRATADRLFRSTFA